MKVIIDRIENNQVVLELPTKEFISCDKKLFPNDIHDGDVLDISITINKTERKQREKEVEALQKKLQNKDGL